MAVTIQGKSGEYRLMGSLFRIMTYNIHENRTLFLSRDTTDSIMQVLFEADADIVCLQEVLERPDEPDELLNNLWRDRWPHSAFGRNAVLKSGVKGNLVLSRYPILRWNNTDISLDTHEERGLLEAVIEVPGCEHPVTVVNIHLGAKWWVQKQQMEKAVAYCSDRDIGNMPFIMAGDFNDFSKRGIRRLERISGLANAVYAEHGKNIRTFPAVFPLLCLDYILYVNLDLKGVRVHDTGGLKGRSDHVPISAEFFV